MNILYLISSLKYGGAEKQTIIDANLMAGNNRVFLGYFFDGPQKEIIDRGVIVIKINKTNYLFTAINIARIIKQNKIQIIHCSLFSSMIISAISTLFCNIKIIWHFHSHEYEIPFIHRVVLKYLSRLPRIKKICFVSRELINHFHRERYKFPESKITLLYNSASIPWGIELHKKNDKNDKIVIGYIGRLVALKRVEYLIELAQYLINQQFTDFEICIVGDGDRYSYLKQETQNKGLSNYILFEGFQKDVERYYRNFSLFVNPSGEECLSIALIDAGIFELPAVAFNTGGNGEIIVNGETGFIADTKKEFFDRILLLARNKELREIMGKKAVEHCSQNFSIETHLRQLENLYREVNNG